MNRRWRGRYPLTLAVLAIAIGSVGMRLVTARPNAPTAQPVRAMPVDARAIAFQEGYTLRQAFSGQVEARRVSTLGFEASGRLDRVRVDEGDRVEAGELLAELDTGRLQARRAELVAAQAETEARLALSTATLRRQRAVVEQGGVSRQGLDEARESQRMARAALRLAEQRIASVDVDLAKTRLVAPFAGTVTDRFADEGRVLAGGEAVVRLQERSVPEIRIGIAGRALETLEVGRVYPLEWRGRTVRARLRALLPVRSLPARTVDALFDPLVDSPVDPLGFAHFASNDLGSSGDDVPDDGLLPGDTVTLALETTVAVAGAWVPLTALAAGERGLWSLYVVRPDPRTDDAGTGGAGSLHVERRAVDVLHQTGDRVFVRGDLQGTEMVVQHGLQRIVPGQRVVIASPQPGAAS